MKSFRFLFILVCTAIIISFVILNVSLFSESKSTAGRPYLVEANRIEQLILHNKSVQLEDYEYIKAVEILTSSNESSFYKTDSDYIIRKINGQTYRFDYYYLPQNNSIVFTANAVLSMISIFVLGLLVFIYFKIIKPFYRLEQMPYELARGNLTMPLEEQKQVFFGKFLWGMDLLREKLEKQKKDELELQKEKKTLVLSLSHDIKTPLGVIELYSKALQRDLYKDENKKKEAAAGISEKCKEIKGYVDEIIKASNEDFLSLEVNNGEFYLSQLIKKINSFYKDKLELLKIDFYIDKYNDCLLQGDIDRAVEVVQNIIENAIKYGDGKSISLSFDEEDGCCVVSVTNSGSHLPENELVHIFDSFWRGSNSSSETGSGLGLYICRQLMYKMGGDIFARLNDDNMTVSVVFSIT